jgi:hypothetical protein
LFELLIDVAADPRQPNRDQAAAALVRLATLLHQDATETSEGAPRPRREPFFVRRQAVAALERSIARFGVHERLEIIESFLLLAPLENAAMQQVLRSEAHPCHPHFIASLRRSKAPGVLDRLAEVLKANNPPRAVLDLVAERSDRRFVEHLLAGIPSPLPTRIEQNLRRLRSISWLETSRGVLLELPGAAQATAIELAIVSGISRQAVFDLAADILRSGAAEGRRAACRALTGFRRPQVRELINLALADPDPDVQVEAARILRRRADLRSREFDGQTLGCIPQRAASPPTAAGPPPAADRTLRDDGPAGETRS